MSTTNINVPEGYRGHECHRTTVLWMLPGLGEPMSYACHVACGLQAYVRYYCLVATGLCLADILPAPRRGPPPLFTVHHGAMLALAT